jgi:nitrate/TMAO reductase-like tetraheme cytochrome c subunit
VTDPNHVQNNFSHDCTQCHSTSGWEPATFDHNQTQFPLTGAHLNLQCIDCHANGYTGTPTDCFSCHDNDYNSVTDPNHVQNNFSHDCTLCHSTNAWEPATFDHNQTQFPLSGAHLNLQCIDCHANGYTGTPTDCYSCHSNDYNSTTNPNHVAAGFPTQCETCHNTSNWTQTTWNHDAQYFPIYSGRHQGEWTVCADCHVDPNNYSVFECIFCHEHNDPNELQSQHQGVSGYQYVSTACYNCHPNGEAD